MAEAKKGRRAARCAARAPRNADDSAARGWIWSDEFVSDAEEFREKYPPGSKEFDYVSGTATWYETIGTLRKNGLLNEKLLFDWLYVTGMWERLKPILVAQRSNTPQLWENFKPMA
jgi:hypothetical protein